MSCLDVSAVRFGRPWTGGFLTARMGQGREMSGFEKEEKFSENIE